MPRPALFSLLQSPVEFGSLGFGKSPAPCVGAARGACWYGEVFGRLTPSQSYLLLEKRAARRPEGGPLDEAEPKSREDQVGFDRPGADRHFDERSDLAARHAGAKGCKAHPRPRKRVGGGQRQSRSHRLHGLSRKLVVAGATPI